ncbi:MAG: hypothetical protein ABH835_02480 [Patescibacteria group bacterium]|nr:hypothetical protein [Patescibacteria group bacterium]
MGGAQPARQLNDGPEQEREPAAVVDIAEARARREAELGEARKNGEVIGDPPILTEEAEVIDFMDKLQMQVDDLSARQARNTEAIESGNFETAKEHLEEEQGKLQQEQAKIEEESKALEALKWGAGKLIELGAYIPGTTDLPRVIDRYAGKVITGTDGLILSPEDHARIAKNQAIIGKYGLKAIALFFPEAKPLVKVAEPIRAVREKLETKKEALAKEGKGLSVKEELKAFAEIIPPEKLDDPEVVRKLGELISAAGRDMKGVTENGGATLEAIGDFVQGNPKRASRVMKGLREMSIKGEIDPSETMMKGAGKEKRKSKTEDA